MSLPRTLVRSLALPTLALLTAVTTIAVVPASASAQPIRPDFWGMHDNNWTSPPGVPVGSANLTTSGTYWSNIEKEPLLPGLPPVYDFTRLDDQVAAVEALGARPMIVLGRVPRFHSADPYATDYYAHMPDVAAWRSYVTALASRYGTRLDYQIWPEPNIVQNWRGTPQQMARLTAEAAKVIGKEAGPKAKVVSPALALRLPEQRRWMVNYFKTKVGGKPVAHYVDAVALDPFPTLKGTPEDSFALLQGARKQLAKIGVRKPLWNNEINYGVMGAGRPTTVRYSDAQSRSLVIRTFVLSAAARVQRTYWLGWFHRDTMGVQMTDSSGTPTAAAEAYEVAHDWMAKTSFQGCRTTTKGKAKGLRTCTLRKSRTEVRRVYWKTGKPVKVKVHRTSRAWENQNGDRRARRGAFKLRVTSQPVMVASRK